MRFSFSQSNIVFFIVFSTAADAVCAIRMLFSFPVFIDDSFVFSLFSYFFRIARATFAGT